MNAVTDQLTDMTPSPSLRRPARETGLSLVEVTVMLAILLILAAMLIPVVSDSISNARLVRAHNDLSQIATAITGFQRDVGAFVFDGSRLREPQLVRSLRAVDVLTSGGEMPEIADSVPPSVSGVVMPDPTVGTAASAMRPWVSISTFDVLDNHLRVNGRGYPVSINGPGNGWNGPYISKDVPIDPWGHCYLVNTGLLRGNPPSAGRCLNCAVYVISAGPNGLLETPFQQPITNANVFGDDIAVRIQ